MPRTRRDVSDQRRGLGRLALQLAVQLPIDPREADFVLRKMKEIHGLVNDDEGAKEINNVIRLNP